MLRAIDRPRIHRRDPRLPAFHARSFSESAYFGFQFNLPLGVAMLFAAIAGVLIAALLGSVRLFKLSRRVRKLEKERETIKRAIR